MEKTNDKKNKETDSISDKFEDAIRKDFFGSDSDDDFDIECDLCRKQFSNSKAYEQHLNSKKHYKMVNKKKIMEKLGKAESSNTEGNGDILEEAEETISCEICSKSFSGYIPYNTHLKSNIHFKNLRTKKLKEDLKDMPEVIGPTDPENENDEACLLQKPAFARCSPCGKVFGDPKGFKSHMAGALHKKKMLEMKTIESLKNDAPGSPEGRDEELDSFRVCDVCNKSFSGPVPYKIHLESAVHEKEVNRAKLSEELKDFYTKDSENQKLVCKQCKKPFPDPMALKAHLESNSHEKQKNKDKVFSFVSEHPEIVAVKSIQNHPIDEENDEYPIGSYFFVCKLCHVSFTGPESVQDHVKSKKHLQMKTERAAKKALQKKLKENNGEKYSKLENKSNHESTLVNGANRPNNTPNGMKRDSESTDDFELV